MQSSLGVIEADTYSLDIHKYRKNKEMKETSYKYSDGIVASFILSLLLGLQAITVLLLPLVWLPKNLMDTLCILADDPVRVQIVSLMTMVTGVSTLVFNTFERRLHVLFAPSVRYYLNVLKNNLSMHNVCPGSGDLFAMGYTKRSLEWKSRMNTVQSGIIITNLLTALAGLTGLCRAIDTILSNNLILVPATVAIGISQVEDLFALQTNNLKKYALNENLETLNAVAIAIITAISIIIVSFKFGEVKFRIPCYSMEKGFATREYKLFQLFPIFISTFCACFAYPGVYALINGSKHNELEHAISDQDNGFDILLHKPFEFGWPKLKYEMIINLLPDVFINIATSVVIFRATRFACGERKTSTKTVANGVLGESLINLVLASFGLSSNVSAFNIGLGKLTEVMNQRMLQLCGLSLILIAIHPPTLLALSNTSVFHLQAIHFLISMLVSVTGLSMMQEIRHLSNRDFTVIGSSIFASIFLPNIALSLRFGSFFILPVLSKLLSSSIFVAISTAILTDKLLGGKRTPEEENDEQNRDNHLSFSEELFSLCF